MPMSKSNTTLVVDYKIGRPESNSIKALLQSLNVKMQYKPETQKIE